MQVKARSSIVYDVTQYNDPGDHANEYVFAHSMPVLDRLTGAEHLGPRSGRTATVQDCKPQDCRYAVFATRDADCDRWFDLKLGWWILELDGVVVGVVSPDAFARNFERVDG